MAVLGVVFPHGGIVLEQVLARGDKRRSVVVSDTSTTTGLSGMEQRGLAGGRVMMDERGMVASTTARPGKVDAAVQL